MTHTHMKSRNSSCTVWQMYGLFKVQELVPVVRKVFQMWLTTYDDTFPYFWCACCDCISFKIKGTCFQCFPIGPARVMSVPPHFLTVSGNYQHFPYRSTNSPSKAFTPWLYFFSKLRKTSISSDGITRFFRNLLNYTKHHLALVLLSWSV